VNIYPSQIDHVLSRIDGIGSEFQIHLRHQEDGRDMMGLKIERGEGRSKTDDTAAAEQVANEIRHKILVRSEVEMVDHGSLPRTERKSKRVFDYRNGDEISPK
jgi:phenylacetate-CoA ligase